MTNYSSIYVSKETKTSFRKKKNEIGYKKNRIFKSDEEFLTWILEHIVL